jgi:hypothetical protein
MSYSAKRYAAGAGALLVSAVLALPAAGQFQNPITAAKDAYKKAKEQQQQQQRQQQQQQQQQQPQQTPAAAQQQASSTATPAEAQAAAPWTPPAETLAAPVALDPLKLPDIVGVHLGMPVAQGLAALHKQYPSDIYEKFPVDWWPDTTKPETGQTLVSSVPGNAIDVHLSYTAPPGPQLVWRMTRFTYNVNINHGTLIAALRAKYGKETLGLTENMGETVTVDSQMANLIWLYNEKGERIPLPPASTFPNRRLGDCWPEINPAPLMPANDDLTRQFLGWCQTMVAVRVAISPQEIVMHTFTEMLDVPLGLRTGRAAKQFLAEAAERQRQQQIERSKAVTPTL